jgi:hypothetical protein
MIEMIKSKKEKEEKYISQSFSRPDAEKYVQALELFAP